MYLYNSSQQKYALLHLLNEERNTWNLVKSLFKDQLRTEQREAIDEEDMNVDQVRTCMVQNLID